MEVERGRVMKTLIQGGTVIIDGKAIVDGRHFLG
jgi:hypothetical protein